jgi:hypothetical protein
MSLKIPSAADHAAMVEKRKLELNKTELARKEEWKNRMLTGAEEFYNDLHDALIKCMSAAERNYYILFFDETKRFAGVPAHVYLYGHKPGKNWQKRTRIPEIEKMPFKRLQDAFKAEGWYLIEVSNPSKGFNTLFKICTFFPESDVKEKLWHGNNVITKD